MNDLVSEMTKLKAELSQLNTVFGVPQYREVAIRFKTQSEDSDGLIIENNRDMLLVPNPKVTNEDKTDLKGSGYDDSIYLRSSNYSSSYDYKIKVVRTSNIPDLKDIDFIIIDPKLNSDNKIVGGIKCKLLYISDNKSFDWELIVQRNLDNSNSSINPLNSVK